MFAASRDLDIEWGMCDPAGIVFNPRYFEFFDWSTALLMRAASGLGKAEILAAHGLAGFAVVETKARFLIPSRYGDRVTIRSEVIHLGRTSVRIRHSLTKNGSLAVEGEEARVCIAYDDSAPGGLAPRPIPEALAAALRGEG